MSATKTFETTEIGTVIVKKNTRSKRIKLQFNKTGTPQVTIPAWMPFGAGKKYASANKAWITDHRPSLVQFKDGMIIGRSERLSIETGSEFSSRLVKDGVKVIVEHLADLDDPDKVTTITNTCYKSLKRQALALAEASLQRHISAVDTDFTKLRIARTHSRWGSCSSNGTLSFSIFIAQIPDDLIDYVVVHELAHTHHMDHSANFWGVVEQRLPDYKQRRRELSNYQLRLDVATT